MKSTLLFFILLITPLAKAQDSHNSMFWNNYTLFNPAASGLFYKHQANAMFRDQWVGVNGAPVTLTGNYNAKAAFIHGGIGVNYQHISIGFYWVQRFNLNYSYHWKLGKTGVLAAGVSAGIYGFGTGPKWVLPANSGPNKGSAFIMNVGLIYKTERFNLGLSSTNINEPEIHNLAFSTNRNYYLNADYMFGIAPKFELKPQVLVRTDMVKYSADINLLAYYNKQYWLGVTYRTNAAIGFMGGWDIKEKYRVGYSYDMTINHLSSISRGSHEIIVAFLLK